MKRLVFMIFITLICLNTAVYAQFTRDSELGDSIEMVNYINIARTQLGLRALRHSEALYIYAEHYTDLMRAADEFTHGLMSVDDKRLLMDAANAQVGIEAGLFVARSPTWELLKLSPSSVAPTMNRYVMATQMFTPGGTHHQKLYGPEMSFGAVAYRVKPNGAVYFTVMVSP